MNTEQIPFGLTFIQALEAIGVIVVCVALLLIVSAFVLDKLNVKSFSLKTGFTFYDDGSTYKTRRTARRVSRKARK